MNSINRTSVSSLLLLGVMLVVNGCASSTTTIWASRVGIYTYDQAVIELGPPDKQARLQDGTLVADWLLRRGYTETYVSPGYYAPYPYYYRYHRPFPTYSESHTPDYFLRLIFAPDGKLQSWKQYTR